MFMSAAPGFAETLHVAIENREQAILCAAETACRAAGCVNAHGNLFALSAQSFFRSHLLRKQYGHMVQMVTVMSSPRRGLYLTIKPQCT